MSFKFALTAVVLTFSLGSIAGPKEDFVDSVVKSCGKSKEDAEKMATPGRSGNVVKWQTCSAATVEIEGCNVACPSSSKIGS